MASLMDWFCPMGENQIIFRERYSAATGDKGERR